MCARFALSSWLLVAAIASPVGAEPCPESSVLGRTFDSQSGSNTFRFEGLGSLTASYDLATLSYFARYDGPYQAPFGGTSFAMDAIRSSDVYVLSGRGRYTPVQLEFELHATATLRGGGSAALIAKFVDGKRTVVGRALPNSDWDRSITLPLRVQVGVPFVIDVIVQEGSSQVGVAAVSMRVAGRFHGIPQGCSIQSCRSYHQEAPPPLAASWGEVRALYR
jgi:hypothetical protein